MTPSTTTLYSPSLVIGCAALIALMVATILLVLGVNDAGLSLVIRNTARTSSIFFTLGFVAMPSKQVFSHRWARWLGRHGGGFLIALAISHLFHAAAIFTLAFMTRGSSLGDRGATVIITGGVAYLFIGYLAFVSMGGGGSVLEKRWARNLYSVGLYFIWAIFFLAYLPRAIQSHFYKPFAIMLAAAFVLRFTSSVRY